MPKLFKGRYLTGGTGGEAALWVMGETIHREVPRQWHFTTKLPDGVPSEAAFQKVPYAFGHGALQEKMCITRA